jgi:hypothetical protein
MINPILKYAMLSTAAVWAASQSYLTADINRRLSERNTALAAKLENMANMQAQTSVQTAALFAFSNELKQGIAQANAVNARAQAAFQQDNLRSMRMLQDLSSGYGKTPRWVDDKNPEREH